MRASIEQEMFGNLEMRIFHSSPRPGHVFMQTSWGNGVQDWVVVFPLHFITFHYLRYIRLRYITLKLYCITLRYIHSTHGEHHFVYIYIYNIYIYMCVRGAWSRRDGRSGVWARGEGGSQFGMTNQAEQGGGRTSSTWKMMTAASSLPPIHC